MTRLLTSVALVHICFLVQSAGAVSMSLQSVPANLSNLTVGQTVQIQVLLGDLAGSQLASLGGTVLFPAGNFGAATNETAGPIVPDAGDLSLFSSPGSTDGAFFAILGSNIAAEGAFFAFDLTAVTPGSGTISIDTLSVFAEDDQLSLLQVDVLNSLSFTILGQVSVPEPASCILLVFGATSIGLRRSREG